MLSGRLRHGILAVCAALALITAESGPAVSQEITASDDTGIRRVPYLTVRDHTGSKRPSSYYGEGRSRLKSGWCEIDQTELPFLAPAADVAPFLVPDEILRVSGLREVSPGVLWDEFERGVGERTPTLYVHGYYVDFEKGCRRATALQENAELSGHLLMFSWPSDGSLINYAGDEVDLYWSVPDIAETIVDMDSQFEGRSFNLVGHSLGARGLFMALYDLATQKVELNIGHVVLAAPDIDYGIFRKLLPRVLGVTDSITIYASASDRPLAISAQVHGYPRLGEAGNDVSGLSGVEVIDVSDLRVMSASGHLYHIYNPEVGADLSQLLNLDRRARERENLEELGKNLWRLLPE